MRIKVIEAFISDASVDPLNTWELDRFQETQIQMCFRLEDEQIFQMTVRAGKEDAFVWVNRAFWFFSKGTLKYCTEKKELVIDPIDSSDGFKAHNRMMMQPKPDRPGEWDF